MKLQDKFIEYCMEGNLLLIKSCIDQGVNVNVYDGRAIRWASENGHTEVVKLLEEHGARL